MKESEGLIGRFVSILMLALVVAFVIAGIAYAEPAPPSRTSVVGDAESRQTHRAAPRSCPRSRVQPGTAPFAPAA